jgi:hypothetical protein
LANSIATPKALSEGILRPDCSDITDVSIISLDGHISLDSSSRTNNITDNSIFRLAEKCFKLTAHYDNENVTDKSIINLVKET